MGADGVAWDFPWGKATTETIDISPKVDKEVRSGINTAPPPRKRKTQNAKKMSWAMGVLAPQNGLRASALPQALTLL
jgi:hypothetical protein